MNIRSYLPRLQVAKKDIKFGFVIKINAVLYRHRITDPVSKSIIKNDAWSVKIQHVVWPGYTNTIPTSRIIFIGNSESIVNVRFHRIPSLHAEAVVRSWEYLFSW